MLQEAQDVHCAFVFDLLQHAVDHDVGARPAHAGAGREEDARWDLLLSRVRKCDGKITTSRANEHRTALLFRHVTHPDGIQTV